MFGLKALLFPCIVAVAAASQIQGVLRHGGAHVGGKGGGFVKALAFKHRLRVCNAYPYAASLDVYRGLHEKLTEAAMPYKACQDFATPLKAGDKLQFKVGDANAGIFSVSDLPNNDAVLLLVIHRHDTLSTAVSFESHVFANLLNAQLAIIDTYKGSSQAMPRIMDAQGGKSSRSEELRYDSVVAVNPGLYEVVLAGKDGETKAKSSLVALNRESYIVLRTGVESQRGQSYPQELVVYPRSDASKLHSGVCRASGSLLAAVVLLAATATNLW
mmetsp:Transcript_60393/g.136128  ORF Transcript_60393/g.136128 Transcript_60393/m.136128 type:complete len:272 (+) Transcript_60393:68-883(+)